MTSQILKKVTVAILILISAGLIVSFLLAAIPDNFVDLSFWQRATGHIKTLVTLKFNNPQGGSYTLAQVFLARSVKSFILIGGSILVVFLCGIPVGILAAFKKNSRTLTVLINFIYTFSAIPILVWALSIHFITKRVFSKLLTLDMLNLYDTFWHVLGILIPIVVISIGDGMLSDVVRNVREETGKVLEQDFIRALRARGVSLSRHLGRALLVPIFSVLSGKVAYLIGGTVIVEYLFVWKGLGYQILESLAAAGNKDYDFILAATLFFVCIILLFQLLNDLAVIFTDPRMRKG